MTEIIFKQPLKTTGFLALLFPPTREQILFPFRIFIFRQANIREMGSSRRHRRRHNIWISNTRSNKFLCVEIHDKCELEFMQIFVSVFIECIFFLFYLVFYFSGWGELDCKATKFWCVLAQVVVGWLVGWLVARLAFGC